MKPKFEASRLDIFDKDGRPLTRQEWSEMLGDSDYRFVKQDTIKGHLVSTVWLGLTHGFDKDGRPLIFETMVFNPGGEEVAQQRYATWTEAEEGHAVHCMQVEAP